MVECGNGDRVLATWKGHTAVITGNISYPSLTRVGAIYITLTADGLVIGELNSSNVPVGYYILIKPADSSDGKPGVEIIDTNGNVVSYFGTFSQIGATGQVRAITTNTGLRIIDDKINSANSVDKIVAKFEDTVQIGLKQKPHVWITNSELQICDSSNYIQAKFGAETVIGYSNNNRVTIDDQTVSIYVGSSTTASASFGSVTTIGKTNSRHVQITSSAVNIRYNNTNLATFTENQISLAQGVATFSSANITLGNSDSALISMCNNNARMAYNDENKTKFDIVASLGMVFLLDQELSQRVPSEVVKEVQEFEDFGYYTDERGYKRWGVIPKPDKELIIRDNRNAYDPRGIDSSDPRHHQMLVQSRIHW